MDVELAVEGGEAVVGPVGGGLAGHGVGEVRPGPGDGVVDVEVDEPDCAARGARSVRQAVRGARGCLGGGGLSE